MSETKFAMISEWMVNGNINSFVKAHPDVDRLELVGDPFKIFTVFAPNSLIFGQPI